MAAPSLHVSGYVAVAPPAWAAVVVDSDLPGYRLDAVAPLPDKDSYRFADGPSIKVAAVAGAVVATCAGRLNQAR